MEVYQLEIADKFGNDRPGGTTAGLSAIMTEVIVNGLSDEEEQFASDAE